MFYITSLWGRNSQQQQEPTPPTLANPRHFSGLSLAHGGDLRFVSLPARDDAPSISASTSLSLAPVVVVVAVLLSFLVCDVTVAIASARAYFLESAPSGGKKVLPYESLIRLILFFFVIASD